MTSTTTHAEGRDGTPLLVRHWAPGATAWATVVLVHGIAEHSGRYERVGEWLSGAGLEVVAADARGFGGSGGRRAYVDRWSQLHDDLEDRIVAARAGVGDRPVVLFGHSLGGLIALGYCAAARPRALPDALVLSAPALDADLPRWQRVVAPILGRLAPTLEIPNGFRPGVLSRDPAVDEAYLADPSNVHRTTARLGNLSFAEQERVRAALPSLAVPTLVYHGADDRHVPPRASEPLASVPGVERRLLPGLRHESHNEPEGERVIADVVGWLRSVLQSGYN
jgi:alpha-beta hydrolase superfamily lysophospholipase